MEISLISIAGKRKPADLFLAGSFSGKQAGSGVDPLGSQFSRALQAAFKNKRFTGKKGEVLSTFNPDFHEAAEVTVVGLGDKARFNAAALRIAVGKIIQLSRSRKAQSLRIHFDSFVGGKVQPARAAEIFADTAVRASYSFDKYMKKSGEDGKYDGLKKLELLLAKSSLQKILQKHIEAAQTVAEGTLRARDLINEPGNVIYPAKLAEEAKRTAREKGLKCTVLGPEELKRLKMGGILGVNQGSKSPPAMIILEHGVFHKSRGTICLVGKGVTFDSGGISIKPAADMEKMKYDKSGACTVIAAMGVIADLKLPLHVVGLAPAVENMPSQNPQRPGDIIRMYSGKTVEVINTDAEGRLILGDALAYCAKFKPKAIIDLATLTGMCAYTFGDKAIGLMGNDKRLLDRIKAAGEETGERCWELPMWDEYSETIKGHHSDLLNTGGKYGGTITAAKFLEEFVPEKTAWAHLDIAGTAWCDSARPDCPKGATGVGVRLLANLLRNWK